MKSINIVLLISFIKLFISEICNFSFSCNLGEKEEYCATKKKTDSNSVYEINLKKCPSMSCNVYDILLGDVEQNALCYNSSSNNNLKNPSYPGGKCQFDVDCLSGTCINKNCTNSIKGECLSHENCPLNTACINGICSNYLENGEKCEDSYQCKFDSYCNKKEKKCMSLFSIENRIDITDFYFRGERIENLCKSGGYYINEKNHVYCDNLTNVDQKCNDVCSYIKSDGKKITSEDKCLCGYNKYRSKFCVLGNSDPVYQEYLEIKKKFIRNQSLTQYCHTMERDFDEICSELINNKTSVEFRKFLQEYNNKKILALQHHRLQESESCVKEVLFNYDTSPIFSLNQKCPIFKCDNKQTNCFYGYNPLKEEGDNINIILNSNSCNEKEICTLPDKNELINTSLIMENKELKGQCKIFQGKFGIKRYPGEKCNINSDCFINNSICNVTCTGVKEGKSCNKTEECLAGNYCNKDKICQKQKDEGEQCEEAWDCKNYLGCYKRRCIKLGSLKKGIKVTKELAPFPGDDKRYLLCSTGELNERDGTTGDFCVENDFDISWLGDESKAKDGKFVKCNFGEECIYHNGKNRIIKYCECGYNSKGQGYCPVPSARNREKWKERVKNIGNYANNNCHSLSRFNCYEKNNYEYYIEKRIIESQTTEEHLFYDSVECAKKLFNQQRNIHFNNFIISLLLVLLI